MPIYKIRDYGTIQRETGELQTYNYDFDIGALIICSFMIFFFITNKGVKRKQNKVFLALALTGLFDCALDILSAIMINARNAYPLYLRHLTTGGFLALHTVASLMLALFIVFALNLHHRFRKHDFLTLSIPAVLSIIICASSPWSSAYYYFDAEGRYFHGALSPILYAVPTLYVLFAVGCVIMYRKALSGKQLISLTVLLIFTGGAGLIQMFFSGLLIEMFCQAIGLLGILISTENESEFYNSRTRVFNRYSFVADIEDLLVTGTRCGAVILKLPNLNYFSASLGVKSLYSMMAQITGWLKQAVSGTTIYDCENGHFVMLLFRENIAMAEDIEKKILDRFEEDWTLGEKKIRFPAQLIYLEIPAQAGQVDQIMRIVDNRFNTRENKSEVVPAEKLNTYRRSVEVEHAIDRAIRDRGFKVFYQPIVHTIADEVTTAEALLRLNDPYLGNIGPDEFIPIAEKNGLIIEIGDFVFEEVCRFYSENRLHEKGIEYIEVNLSMLQCMDPGLLGRLKGTLDRFGVEPSRINLEITETEAASNPEMLIGFMKECRSIGMTFSLDDFGTGYSNLSRTLTMPFSMIKLDKSLLWDAESDRNVRVIMTNMMRIFRELGMEILAEGIETIAQKKLLERLGCDYMQGFLYSRPMSEDDFLGYIDRVKSEGHLSEKAMEHAV